MGSKCFNSHREPRWMGHAERPLPGVPILPFRNHPSRRVNSVRMDGRFPGVIAQADIASLLQRAKLRLLEMHYQSKVGHIGGNLSALDILISLYHFCLGPNDKFLLSKGHSAGALYVTLWT